MERTLIVSDLHLGASNSEGGALLALLQLRFDRLILNGDTVDHLDFRRFRPCDWRVVQRLQLIAQERELVLIRGNHDAPPRADRDAGRLNLLARLVGAEVREEFVLEVGVRNYLVLHGDQFDDTMNLTRVGAMADSCYRVLQRCNRSVATWAKQGVKRWTGAATAVQERAVAHARQLGFDGVIAGHTHFCADEHVGDIHYLNSGCWVDWPCTYLCAEAGGIHLRLWQQRQPGTTPIHAVEHVEPAPAETRELVTV